MSSRPVYASRTTFENLAVDSGEGESEEEVLVEETPAPVVEAESKPTKSALKKLAKAARQEKKQQQKLAKQREREQNGTPTTDTAEVEGVAKDISQEEYSPVPLPDQPLENSELLVNQEVPPPLPPPKAEEPAMTKEEALAPPQPVEPEVTPPKAPQPPPVPQSPPIPEPKLPISQPSQADSERVKKRQSFITRTLWTFIMIAGFIALLLLGPAYMIVLVMVCQGVVYREVTALFSLTSKDTINTVKTISTTKKDPWSKTLNWYFFAITNYFLYGESITYYFKHVVFVDAHLTIFATHHRLISFTLYTIGLMGFVMSLKKGHLKQQFGLFCWVHMSLLLIVVSSHFIVNNILEGMIWFWVPASLVICNDVFAYIWGITLGRTPLIELSPKKTVEGFVGAFISTMLFALAWGSYFMQFNYMICPIRDLGASAFSGLSCNPNPVFLWKDWVMPGPLSAAVSTLVGRTIITVPYCPYHLHLLCLAFFASAVAPFGGFFASGFKRAFNIKDFGHSIPGHGGMTDRMDCQFLMGVFTYVYYSSLLRQHHVTVGSALQMIVSGLSVEDQLTLISGLKEYLEGQGIAVP